MRTDFKLQFCRGVAAFGFLAAALPTAFATSEDSFFSERIEPVLREHCYKCHAVTANKIKGGLRLDSARAMLEGGDSGPAIVPGDPEASLLIRAIGYEDPAIQMPPTGKLADEIVRDLEQWVRDGAHDPRSEDSGVAQANSGESEKPPSVWWSLTPLVRPEVPEFEDRWIENPIDAFVLTKLRDNGLNPAPRAERDKLIRRVWLDVIGLPPAPLDVTVFESNDSATAYEKLVDETLASPHYGERWARHWLDVARFAETNGFETNTPRDRAWPYRDYVIRAFNEDKPYDRFVLEQIAGDAFGAPEGTGFLVGGAWDEVKSPDKELTANQRANELHDMVSTLSGAFLGLTTGCARCHDHKFDPISQKDYYAMTAVLAGVNHGEREMEQQGQEERRAEVSKLEKAVVEISRELQTFEPLADVNTTDARRAAVNARMNVERFEPVTARAVRFTIEATNSAEPCFDEIEVMSADGAAKDVALASAGGKAEASGSFVGSDFHKLEHVNDGAYGNERSWISNEVGAGWVIIRWPEAQRVDTVLWARDRNGAFADRLATEYRIELETEDGEWRTVATSADRRVVGTDGNNAASPPLVVNPEAGNAAAWLDLKVMARLMERRISELRTYNRVYAGVFTEPEATRLLKRGDPMQPQEPVAPGGIEAVAPALALPPDLPERERRVALARWITSRGNPLTARVMVNRIWHYHFGEGLVATPSDFGVMGAKPSHPELLDWLAAEFIESGWSIKHIQKLILMSATYRQSSEPNARAAAVDAGSRLLWRFPPRRMEAESLRDTILFVSGSLNPAMGGPGFSLFEPNQNYVRVYVPKAEFGADEFRRMVYQTKPRNVPDQTFGVFDCPEAAQPQPRRTSSTTALQALNLLNSSFMVDQAKIFAHRVERDCAGGDELRKAARAFELAMGRMPEEGELIASARLAHDHGLAILCRALFNANEFVRIE